MAEMALAAFGTIGAGIAQAGAAVGSAVGAMGTALPAASTVGSILSGVATAGSVLSSMMAADQARTTGQVQQMQAAGDAELSKIEGDRAALESQAKAIEIRRDTLRKIAANRVAFAGSGLDISSGQLAAIENDIQGEADYALSLEASKQRTAGIEAGLNANRTLARGQNAMLAAKAKSTASEIDAAATGAKGLLSIVKRG